MIAGSLIVGVGAALVAGGGALTAGLPVIGALGCYMLGGSAGFLGTLAIGALSGSGPADPGGRSAPRQSRACLS